MKRKLLLFVFMCGCLAVSANRSNDGTGRYLGDCDNDSIVDVTDITIMVNFILNGNPTSTSTYQYNYNVFNTNKDTTAEIDVSDITALVNIILSGTLELVEESGSGELPVESGVGSGIPLTPKKIITFTDTP